MNYIKHLNGIFEKFRDDDQLNPTHISLYWALFHCANFHRFPEEFFIDRKEIMDFAKIGSTATYHKCLRELDAWKYIRYMPSHNRFRGSKIHLFNFQTSAEQVLNEQQTSAEQALIPKYKHDTNNIKHEINKRKGSAPKNYLEIFEFLKNSECAKDFSAEKLKIEARKFFNHYSANGWKIGGKTPMENWRPAVENWLLKAVEFETANAASKKSKTEDHLHTEKSKNYNQPL